MGTTDRFGLSTFGPRMPGTSIDDDGGKFSDSDRLLLDRILQQFESHSHQAGGTRLGDPSAAPTANLLSSGGSLPGGRTYAYAVTFIDQFGMETAPSPTVTVTTPSAVSAPLAPDVQTAVGGSLVAGTYYYGITYLTADGGETSMSNPNVATVVAGEGSVIVAWGDLPSAVTQVSVWRRPTSKTYFTRIATVGGTGATDDGSVLDDPCACEPENQPPDTDETSSSSSVTVTLSSADQAVLNASGSTLQGWCLYRTELVGSWPGQALVQRVALHTTADDPDTPFVTSWTDIGDDLLYGAPPSRSQTLQPPTAITPLTLSNLSGTAAEGTMGMYQSFPFIRMLSGWHGLMTAHTTLPSSAPDGATVITPAGAYLRVSGAWAAVASGGGGGTDPETPASGWSLIPATIKTPGDALTLALTPIEWHNLGTPGTLRLDANPAITGSASGMSVEVTWYEGATVGGTETFSSLVDATPLTLLDIPNADGLVDKITILVSAPGSSSMITLSKVDAVSWIPGWYSPVPVPNPILLADGTALAMGLTFPAPGVVGAYSASPAVTNRGTNTPYSLYAYSLTNGVPDMYVTLDTDSQPLTGDPVVSGTLTTGADALLISFSGFSNDYVEYAMVPVQPEVTP